MLSFSMEEAKMKKGIKLTISGTVQRVFFRQFCKENADKFGLKGFVRNLDDGNVELVVEGESEGVEQMIAKIREGPPHSQIRDVQVEEKKWSGEFKIFKVLRI